MYIFFAMLLTHAPNAKMFKFKIISHDFAVVVLIILK